MRVLSASLVSILLLFTACGGEDTPRLTDDGGVDAEVALDMAPLPDPVASFVASGQESYFDLPWPSDLRMKDDGHIDLEGFPRSAALVGEYVDAIESTLTGWGTQSAVYFRFNNDLQRGTLPADATASKSATASVQFIDITEGAPEFGTRIPYTWHFQSESSMYYASHVLALRPLLGEPLRAQHRYAVVVTNRLLNSRRSPFARDRDFEALLSGDTSPAIERVRTVYGPALDALDELGVSEDDIVSLAVFTTLDPVSELFAVRDWTLENYEAPHVVEGSWVRTDEYEDVVVYEARYGPSPIFQRGTIPYTTEGGEFVFDEDGNPVVQGSFEARFSLAVPKTPPPSGGYPVVLCAHGTTGDYRTCVDDDEALIAARAGFATFGVDQIHHGERNPAGGDPSLLFFNVLNPAAARDNTRQSAIDVVQQARLVANMTIPSDVGLGDVAVAFDASHMAFFGHSQGSLNGPLFLAADDSVQSGALSGPGAAIGYTLLEKTEPVNIPEVLRLGLGLRGTSTAAAFEREGMSLEHPVISLVQTWIEVSDSANYAPFLFDRPREGFAPKSMVVTMGLRDVYATANSAATLFGAMRLPIVRPVALEIEALTFAGVGSVTLPVQGNVAGGAATAVGIQSATGGHFVVYSNEVMQNAITSMYASSLTGIPEIR